MSAYPNYELQPYTDDPSSPAEWTRNGGATSDTDALTDGTDTKYLSTSTHNDEAWFDFNSNWSRDPRCYELIVMKVRARYSGTGTCQVRMRVTNALDAYTEDLTTSWVDYWIATCVRSDLSTGIQIEGTVPYTSNTAYHGKVVATISSGTPTVEVSEVRYYTIPIADHGLIYPDSDGSNEGWSLQTGTDSYAMVDNSQSLTDWTGTGLADDSTDYLHSDADDERTDLGLTTPTYGIGAGDFVVVWLCANNTAGTLNIINPVQVDLIESGTSFTTQMWGIAGVVGNRSNKDSYQIDDSSRIPRFSPVVLQLDSTPSNWANVQIKLVSDTITAGTREPSIFSIAVISGFGYDPPVNQNLTVTDTVSITGATGFSRGQSLAVTDTINTADATSRIQNLQLNAASSVAITGAISRTLAASMAKTDTLNLADVTTLGQNLALSLADTFNQADTVQQVAALALSIADSLNLTDAVTRVLGASLTVNDSFNTGDVDSFVQGLLESYTDTITLSEAVTILVVQIIAAFDTLNLADTFSAQLTAIKTATDTIQLSDALTSLLQAAASHADFVQYGDALTATASFVKAFTDTTNVIDAITMSSQAIKTLADTFGLADTTALVSALAKAHTDSFTLADVIGLQLGLASIFESGVSFGDTVTIRAPQLVSLSDTIQFWDWAGFTASATATPTFTLAGIVVAASVTMLAVNVVPNINISGLRIDPSVGLDSVDIT